MVIWDGTSVRRSSGHRLFISAYVIMMTTSPGHSLSFRHTLFLMRYSDRSTYIKNFVQMVHKAMPSLRYLNQSWRRCPILCLLARALFFVCGGEGEAPLVPSVTLISSSCNRLQIQFWLHPSKCCFLNFAIMAGPPSQYKSFFELLHTGSERACKDAVNT